MSADKKIWPTLDILRGLAVICMVCNHAAVKLLSAHDAASGVTHILNFIGSFAPVLFFFATGIGYGFSHKPGKRGNTKDVLIKAAILIVADIFMRGGDFTSFGWDFLAFIAFSMVLLHCIRGTRHGITLSMALIFMLLLLRYLLGALYASSTPPEERLFGLSVVFGLTRLDNVSYWFTPWLAYPLAGFVVGAMVNRYRRFYDTNVLPIGIGAGIAALCVSLLCYILWANGAILFRWGTMSLNFFIASIACLLAALSIAFLVGDQWRQPRVIRALSLRGVSSLAVVPIHYFLLHLITLAVPLPVDANLFLLALPPLIILCFLLANAIDQLARALARPASMLPQPTLILGVVVLAVISMQYPDASWLIATNSLAELLLCLLLGFSYTSRQTQPAPDGEIPASPERTS